MRVWTLFFLLLFSCNSHEKPILHIFTWSNYILPEIVEEFEKKCDCRVIVDTFDSNESMYAKLKLGASSYDVLFPSNYFLNLLLKQNMVQKLDLEQIPNSKGIDPRYLVDDDFALPFLIGYSGIAYRKDKVKDFSSSWEIFFRKDLKGRMTLLNDMREAFGAALLFLGKSVNTTSSQDIEEAANILIQWKKNIAKFESEQYKNGIASAEFLVVQGYAGDIMQVMGENKEVAFAYPKEGTPLSIDYIVIPKEAKNAPLAHAFINFLLDPKVAARGMQYNFYLSPVKEAVHELPQELQNNPTLFPPPSVREKAELIEDVGENITLYFKAWDKVKAS